MPTRSYLRLLQARHLHCQAEPLNQQPWLRIRQKLVVHLHPCQLTLEPFHHPRLHLVRDFHVPELHVALYDLCLALCLIMTDCSLFLTRLVFVCQVVLGSCLLIRNHHSRQTHPHHRASVHSPELASTTKPKLGSDTIATEAGYALTTK